MVMDRICCNSLFKAPNKIFVCSRVPKVINHSISGRVNPDLDLGKCETWVHSFLRKYETKATFSLMEIIRVYKKKPYAHMDERYNSSRAFGPLCCPLQNLILSSMEQGCLTWLVYVVIYKDGIAIYEC